MPTIRVAAGPLTPGRFPPTLLLAGAARHSPCTWPAGSTPVDKPGRLTHAVAWQTPLSFLSGLGRLDAAGVLTVPTLATSLPGGRTPAARPRGRPAAQLTQLVRAAGEGEQRRQAASTRGDGADSKAVAAIA
jgi:hypothetical protein